MPTISGYIDETYFIFNGDQSLDSTTDLIDVVSSGNEVSIYFGIPSATNYNGLFHARNGSTTRVQVREENQWFIGDYANRYDPGISGNANFFGGMQRNSSDNISFSINGTFTANVTTDTTSSRTHPILKLERVMHKISSATMATSLLLPTTS